MEETRSVPAPASPEAPASFWRQQLLARRGRLSAPGLSERQDLAALIRDVDAALERLEDGSFGLCDACHDPIEHERLAADPLTRVCLGCLSPEQARALERDLELAAVIQGALLPADVVELGGWEIHYRYAPLGAVSGDHCDVIRPATPEEPLHFVLGDVSGKGVAASILMSQLHAIFRSLIPLRLPLAEILRLANRLFADSTLPNCYATLVAGRLNPGGRLEIGNAGHCLPLLARNGSVTPLSASGLPLGLFSDTRFEVDTLELRPRDLLLLYTDGLSEARGASGEQYGAERVARVLQGSDGRRPADVIRSCLEDAERFRGAVPLEDDLTMMAIRRSPGPGTR